MVKMNPPAYIGCLMLCRTALIALQRNRNVSQLVDLKDKGVISETLYKQADEVRLWANVVGHENINPEMVNKEDTEQLIIYVESLLDAMYVQPNRLAVLTNKRKEMQNNSGSD